jgi:hypothetical protein
MSSVTRQPAPEPGMYEQIPFAEYAAWDAINNSSLGPALISAAHYRAYLEQDRTETDSMRFGSLVHAGKLDPKDLLNRYVVMPDFRTQLSKEYANPRASKEYKEKVEAWEKQVHGKQIVEQSDFDLLSAIVVALDSEPLARECLGHSGPAEVSLVWRDETTGLLCKGRIDKLDHTRKRFADLKTARSLEDYSREIANRGYHRQAAFYVDGLQAITGDIYEPWLVPVEKTPPFAVAAAPVDSDALIVGRLTYRRALRVIAKCRKTDNYPPLDSPAAWTVPMFAMPSITITGASGPITL